MNTTDFPRPAAGLIHSSEITRVATNTPRGSQLRNVVTSTSTLLIHWVEDDLRINFRQLEVKATRPLVARASGALERLRMSRLGSGKL